MKAKGIQGPGVAKCVLEAFSSWHDSQIEYSTIRGWDGKKVTGSDIDVLVRDRDFVAAGNILRMTGFKQTRRHWALFDLLAKEGYWDRILAGYRLRFHLATKILFGKPARIIRLPIEDPVLDASTIDDHIGCRLIPEAWACLAATYRLGVDKPSEFAARAPRREQLDALDGVGLSPELATLVERSTALIAEYQDSEVEPQRIRGGFIQTLKVLPQSEFSFRRIQSRISRLLLRLASKLSRIRTAV